MDLLAWVDAASRASVLSGYAHAAAKLGLDHDGDAEAVAARFLAWLEGTSRPWLVVLDDLHDAADLDGLMPAGPAGRVLITTADAATVGGVPGVLTVAVPVFSIREALGYLSGLLTTDPDQRNGAIDLAGELGCDPAALGQAAAVIISTGISCGEYREYLIDGRSRFAAAGGPTAAMAGLTWRVSASHAEQLVPGGAWPLLVLAALAGGHGVPGMVFTAPATCQYLAGQDGGGPPDPQLGLAGAAGPAADRAGGHRCGGHAASGVAEPGGAGGRSAPPRRRNWRPRRPGRWLRRWRRCGRMGRRDRRWPRGCGRARPACGGPPGMRCGRVAAAPGCCWRPGAAWTGPGWPARRWPGGGS